MKDALGEFAQFGLRCVEYTTERSNLPMPERELITEFELTLVRKVSGARMVPGSGHKRFIRDLNEKSKLSNKGRAFLAWTAFHYRRQYKLTQDDLDYISRHADDRLHGAIQAATNRVFVTRRTA